MGTLLVWWEKEKKETHGKYFHDKWKCFSTFFLYVDEMIRDEALVVLTNLSRLMAEKTEKPFCACMDGLIVVS